VTICDPREEYTETWDIPGVTLVRTMPDDTARAMKLDERCAVVALTHDPKLDDLALLEALRSPAFYVGALGSRANNAKRPRAADAVRPLRGADRPAARPIGIYIAAHAAGDRISILAEITAVQEQTWRCPRSRRSPARRRRSPAAGVRGRAQCMSVIAARG